MVRGVLRKAKVAEGEEIVFVSLIEESRGGKGSKGKGGSEKAKAWLEDGRLSLEEAAFLVEKGKLRVEDAEGKELSVEGFLSVALAIQPRFMLRYIVFKDLRERGYAVRCGTDFFWLFPRGSKGEKPAKAFIRIFSERDAVSLAEIEKLVSLAENMRKEAILAIVDEESDITYYEVRSFKAADTLRNEAEEQKEGGRKEGATAAEASLLGDRVFIWDAETARHIHDFGTLTQEGKLQLSLVEAAYLLKKGIISVKNASEDARASAKAKAKAKVGVAGEECENVKEAVSARMDFSQFVKHASAVDECFSAKFAVYEDLREQGLIPKTGFKFGSHFRVYEASCDKHSAFLVHVLPAEHTFSTHELARAVRLAHGVRKRMLFAFIRNGGVKYVEVARKKL
ncbi:MAG: tRNA-intron lyase [Candidatus Methanospirare jalkutatii]|nr:MAG: tRNA-intron lyase [Candidatus Methanospirare jalkutatii]